MNYSIHSSLINSLNQVRDIYTESNTSNSLTEDKAGSIEPSKIPNRSAKEKELFQWLDEYLKPSEQGTAKTAQEIQTALNQQLRSIKLDLAETFKDACVTNTYNMDVKQTTQFDNLLTFLGKLVLLTKQPNELIQSVENHSSEYLEAKPFGQKQQEINHTTTILEDIGSLTYGKFIVQLMKEIKPAKTELMRAALSKFSKVATQAIVNSVYLGDKRTNFEFEHPDALKNALYSNLPEE